MARVSSSAAAVCVVALAAALATPALADVVLTPQPGTQGKPPVGLVLLPADGLTAAQYTEVATACQSAAATTNSLWVGIADSGGTTVTPSVAVPRVVAAMAAQGYEAGGDVYQFLGAHSPSQSKALLDYVASGNATDNTGLVLMGGFVTRDHRGDAASGKTFVMPVLTVAGELDGVARLTRAGAEAYYTQISRAADPSKAAVDFPVVVIPGASHMSFASGAPSALAKSRDLVPTANATGAHVAIGAAVGAFVSAHASTSDTAMAATAGLAASVHASKRLVQPLIDAMMLEGSHRLHDTCDSDYPTNPACQYPMWPNKTLIGPPKPAPSPLPPSDCICGSNWVMQTAQKMMAGFAESSRPSVGLVTKDAFHDVADVSPFHLPHLFNNCSAARGRSRGADDDCTLNGTTVTMPIYTDGSSGVPDVTVSATPADDGIAPLSAFEFRTKLKSREAMWQAAGIDVKNVNATDGNLTMCRAINQASLDWAMANASPSAKARFLAVGEPIIMVDDVVSGFGITGPQWIKDLMVYKRVAHSGPGKATTAMTIQSWTMTTENYNHGNVPFWIPAGYHYCKLYTPAAAMEWITVDGLRQFGSLANATSGAPAQ